MSEVVYLDYNATAPLRPEALAAMLPVFQTVGNAASPHVLGRQSAAWVATARRQLAELIGCSATELIFTSGATEANNLALHAALRHAKHVITTAVEHPAVLETARTLSSDRNVPLTVLPVDQEGRLDMPMLRRALDVARPAIVSVMAANNETGVLFDLAQIVEFAHAVDAVVHTDATQLVGKVPLNVSQLGVDLLSLSAHKFGGPQGVGALFICRSVAWPLNPLLHGGGQEKGLRAGTLNVAGIVGTGAAAEATNANRIEEYARISALRDMLESQITQRIPGSQINGRRAARLPNVSSITFPGAPADAVLAQMPDVAASDGSACASGSQHPSHVLLAMGMRIEDAESTIRFSMGYSTSEQEVLLAVEAVRRAVLAVRSVIGYADTDEYDCQCATGPIPPSLVGRFSDA